MQRFCGLAGPYEQADKVPYTSLVPGNFDEVGFGSLSMSRALEGLHQQKREPRSCRLTLQKEERNW